MEEVSPPSLLRGLPISGASRFLLAVTGQSPAAACRWPANRARLVGAGPRCALSLELTSYNTHHPWYKRLSCVSFCLYQLVCHASSLVQMTFVCILLFVPACMPQRKTVSTPKVSCRQPGKKATLSQSIAGFGLLSKAGVGAAADPKQWGVDKLHLYLGSRAEGQIMSN